MKIIKPNYDDFGKWLRKNKTKKELIDSYGTVNPKEIRGSYVDNPYIKIGFSYLPPNTQQLFHFHKIITESIQLIQGELEIGVKKKSERKVKWKKMREGDVVVFQLNQLHTIRTPARSRSTVKCPYDKKNYAAYFQAYKWIEPKISVTKKEMNMILEMDWFNEEYFYTGQSAEQMPFNNPKYKKKIPLFLTLEEIYKKTKF